MKTTLFILVLGASVLFACKKDNPGPNEVFINGSAFSPSSISISSGTTIKWTNKESVTHTVTSDSTGLFDSGDMGKDKTFSFTFTKPGTFNYHCNHHSMMKASVVVS